ncbi:hypothetical protein F6V30_09875 [Oryzomonas sagensis]|uniref:SPOR domain-containing protein n=1 Tax=Oryzomonas sagensis TaxID=2603857 RepID=A0ABQ6TQ49_9BACT|nr:TolC family protein [Oryzomonas sagensis]KAB0670445.1 hypothetical protein F6V30_09875 [Oryzomonas sagensis]
MIAPAKQMLACLSLLVFSPMLPHAQAADVPSPPPSTVPSALAASPQNAERTGQPPPQLFLSRGYAVALAVYRNIDLRIEALNFKMAETDTARSWGIYNPVLSATGTGGVTAIPGDPFFSARTLNATVGVTQNLPTGGSIGATTQTGYFSVDSSGAASKNWQSTAGLTLTLPLLKNAGREVVELNITLAASTQQDSLERFRATTMEMVSNVITAYNHLYVLRQTMETRVAALTSAQKLLDEVRKKSTPEPVQGMELANAEFAVAQRRKDLVEASRSVKDQEINFRYLIGLDSPTQIIPSDPPSRDEPQETDEQAVKAALEYRSDLKQLHLSLKTAQLQERVNRRQSWPDLSLTGGGGLTGSGFHFGESYQQIGGHPGSYWNVGMQFSVPLGNTAAANDYRKSRIRTEQVQDQIRALSWKIRNDVGSDMRALISARLQMQLSDRSSQLAEQRLAEYRKNNQAGSATLQDVLNAENDWNSARNAQLEASETFSNAVTKLWKDAGLLLDRHGIHIDTSHPDKLTGGQQQNPALLVEPPPPAAPPVSPASPAVQGEPHPPKVAPSATPAASITEQKPTTGDKVKPPATAPAPAPAAPHRYTLTIGEYETKSAMADAVRRIKRAGLTPLVKRGPTKTEAFIRLHIADHADRKMAQREIGRLRRFKAEGFAIKDKEGTFTVYAGSYRNQKQASIEQERLAALGVTTVLKNDTVQISTFLLTVGNFASPREAAAEYGARLEKQGLKAVITKNTE